MNNYPTNLNLDYKNKQKQKQSSCRGDGLVSRVHEQKYKDQRLLPRIHTEKLVVIMVHAYNPNTSESERQMSEAYKPASLSYLLGCRPVREPISNKKQN